MNNITGTFLGSSFIPFAIMAATISIGTYVLTAASLLGYIRYKKANPRKPSVTAAERQKLQSSHESLRAESRHQQLRHWWKPKGFRSRRGRESKPVHEFVEAEHIGEAQAGV